MKIYNCYLSTAIVAAASLTVITSSSIKLVQVQDMSGCIDPWINSTDSSVGIGWISAWYECLLYTDLFYISWSEGFLFSFVIFLHNLQLYSRNRFLIKWTMSMDRVVLKMLEPKLHPELTLRDTRWGTCSFTDTQWTQQETAAAQTVIQVFMQ